ncbi:MAG TPA: efflux RND transporter periplasmic adaptor subunit, partial [Gammaproteobacteria bacterium]|nr:efflux RND transporter periplasmic adaptor subunit [Gammaproteobacteria bacterium]
QPVAVRVVQAQRRDFARESTQPAAAEAFFEADLGAKVSGHVSELTVDIGTHVKANQVLARISVPELVQARNAAAADVTALRSARDRTAALAERKSVTERALVEAESRLAAAVARQAEAEAELDYTLIRAPFDGVVTLRTIDPGDMVYQASSPKGKAEPLLRVAKLDVIRVKTFVAERDSVWANPGDAATVTFDALPGRAFTGTVARMTGVLDPGTRTMQVEIDLPNADGAIRPGLYGQTRISLERHAQALALPAAAVGLGDGGAYVLVVAAGDTVRRKSVTLGLGDAQWTEITGGLDATDRVAVAPSGAALTDGARVRVDNP